MKKTLLLSALSVMALTACSGDTVTETKDATGTAKEIVNETVNETVKTTEATALSARSLDDILAVQSDANKTRFQYRNPKATIEYFGIEPGMTVAEVLPGGGWYSKILIPYLGDEGHLVGIDYDPAMWAEFGGFADEDFLKKKESWAAEWVKGAQDWRDGSKADISAFAFGSVPADMKGKVDVVFLPRAIHHLNRFEQAHLASALEDMRTLLKPEGIVAVVAHRAAEDQPDDWANGDNGYMKQSTIVEIMSSAGFELAGSSEINANPKDQAKAANKDMVWRLPPSLATSREDPELRAKMEAIGETDRMTLKFKLK